MNRKKISRRFFMHLVLGLFVMNSSVAATKTSAHKALSRIQHIVIIYEENHSFDNLFGGWEGVHGLNTAPVSTLKQVSQEGIPFSCLQQNDVNLTSPPLRMTCTDKTTGSSFQSHFKNQPFIIDQMISPSTTTCPPLGIEKEFGVPASEGVPGGCTRDLVHRFYQEQYQMNDGQQNRYVTGSDAVGLSMGVYATKQLPIYRYLHAPGHPPYAIADHFFQAAFGGSFLNHQWLIAAKTPVWPNAVNDGGDNDLHSVVDSNGMPSQSPLYHSPAGDQLKDLPLTASCHSSLPRLPTPAGIVCGDYAVNTIQPVEQPYRPGTARHKRLPLQTVPTIGDRLTAAGIDWAWYSGGWSNANGDINAPGWTNGHGSTCTDSATIAHAKFPHCPHQLFQFHHQPFNYYAAYAEQSSGNPLRQQHLADEEEFTQLAQQSIQTCQLKPVSFIKPMGAENEHPGYSSQSAGSTHLVKLIQTVVASACYKDTLIIVNYDEFGGQWDHVSPPGQGGTPGNHDQFGPGTRIPALIIAASLPGQFVVDHTQYDTTSILATIERRFGLSPLGTRDRAANDLSAVFRVTGD
jgi:acid phosphatase